MPPIKTVVKVTLDIIIYIAMVSFGVWLVIVCVSRVDYSPKDYIQTEYGILPPDHHKCTLGMLTTKDGHNVFGKHSKPITCHGVVRLTHEEYKAYLANEQ